MRELHFDLAGAPVPQLLPALLSVADIKHILMGVITTLHRKIPAHY
jgi:hypothetical protein